MISVAEAREKVLNPLQQVACETVSLDQAQGRILGYDQTARRTQPPEDMSAMDGWAIRHADLDQPLTPIGESAAGSAFTGTLPPGGAVRIFTGAVVPRGADTIVLQEDADVIDGVLHLRDRPPAGKHIRPRGLDFHRGDTGLAAGKKLTARDIALLAAMDVPWVSVRRKPRIAILATGDELVRPGEPLAHGQIIASNNLGIACLVRDAGGDPIDLGIAPDRIDALGDLAAGARGADMLVTIGGASVGDHDLVRTGLTGRGLEVAFHKIAMRPGKPLMSGIIDQVPFLGLPGNPVSAMVCGYLFLVPAVWAMLGRTIALPEISARTTIPLRANDKRADFLRCTLERRPDGTVHAAPFDSQDSSILTILARADGLLLRAPFAPEAPKGSEVSVIPFDQVI